MKVKKHMSVLEASDETIWLEQIFLQNQVWLMSTLKQNVSEDGGKLWKSFQKLLKTVPNFGIQTISLFFVSSERRLVCTSMTELNYI